MCNWHLQIKNPNPKNVQITYTKTEEGEIDCSPLQTGKMDCSCLQRKTGVLLTSPKESM